MNKNAREKQLLEEAYSQVLGENWKKGTSKAPKGASFDSKKNYKPSGVDANSDGPGGRYRRTRPPGYTTITHGEAGISSDEEIKVGSMVTTNYGEVVHIDEIDTDSDMKGRPVYIGTDRDGGDHILYPDQIHAVSDEEHPRDSMYLKDDPEALKKALDYHRRNVAKLGRKSFADLTDEEYDSLKHSEGELELNESEEDKLESIELGGDLYEVGAPDPSNESELIISIVKHANGYMITTGQFSSPEDFTRKGPDSAIEAGGYALTLDGKLMKEDDLEDGIGYENEELNALINGEDAEDVDVDENKDEDKHVTDEAEAFKEVEQDTPE